MKYRKRSHKPSKINFDRNKIFSYSIYLIAAIMFIKLFTVQVLSHNYYQQIAAKEHYGYSELPAHRGEIYIQDYASGDKIRVATNITLDLLYADPTMIKNKKLVADRITPLIYNHDEAKKINLQNVKDQQAKAPTPEDAAKIKPLTDNELYAQFYNNILEKISEDQRQIIILSDHIDNATATKIKAASLSGIEVTSNNVLKAYPPQITNLTETAATLGKILQTPTMQLENILRGRNRYVILKRKITLGIAAKIDQIIKNDKNRNFTGLGLKEEYYRYYPEGTLASNIIGFVTPAGNGSYGIESNFNTQLRGKNGVFETQKDSVGRLITVGNSTIQPAVDGDNITLTIDRTIQLTVENELKRAVINTKSNSGQVLIMNPKTGAIIAMANYPTYNPNNYSTVYDKKNVTLKPDEITNLIPIKGSKNTYWLYANKATNDRIMIFKNTITDGSTVYQEYKNKVGPEVYQNKTVSLPYEPGSVFKSIIMSIGIDDGDVSPSTYIDDPGVYKVDTYKIHDVSAKCTGHVNMAEILAESCNTGMAHVTARIGRSLLQSYLIKYGFGQRTEIEFDNESAGKINKGYMAASELATAAFGQGLTVTPIQIVMAYSALANNGILMQPHIVSSIATSDGKVTKTEPSVLGQVIKPKTAKTITEMMVGAIENGVARGARLDKYYIAGKTGTSQTYKYGKPLTGIGTTIATIAGFGPVEDPKFVVFVKLDHPHTSEWAETTAEPLFKNMFKFLFNYYSIPPDRK